jgi:type II secretory pathway component PulF
MIPENNNAEIATLKNQVFTLLVALIVVSGTLTVYLYRQAVLAGKDLAQGQQLSAVLNKNDAVVSAFITKLVAYGEKHPDFVPVLKKYGIAPIKGIPADARIGVTPKN